MGCSSSSPIHRIPGRVRLHRVAFSFSPLVLPGRLSATAVLCCDADLWHWASDFGRRLTCKRRGLGVCCRRMISARLDHPIICTVVLAVSLTVVLSVSLNF
uniref:Uncharacterized protein n=1 Tax=Setaria viridis TaxID=4556 RepID=A0A4U6VEN1_SETVI|nr:hypothetical protein SEVIR_3G240700v2 [Setaria viridis]